MDSAVHDIFSTRNCMAKILFMKFCCKQHAKKIDSTAVTMESASTESIIIASAQIKDLQKEIQENTDQLISYLYTIYITPNFDNITKT